MAVCVRRAFWHSAICDDHRVRAFRNVMGPVADAIRDVSETIIEARFRTLGEGEIEEKSVGELVTIADNEAEAALTARLARIVPGAPVVGEEGCAADPSRLSWLGAERAWLVDPLDGTANFIAGSADWAVMVALLADGHAVCSWVWQPMTKRMYMAERGAGAYCDGLPLKIKPRGGLTGGLSGAVLTRFMEPAVVATVARNHDKFAKISPGRRCSGVEYPAVIDGVQDFALFWRTLPWDHVPGALLLEEAGGVAARPSGTPYLPYTDGVGLLVAADQETWSLARQLLN
jgi:fructose-1,6-bisphosphatase/inositol monophosphatase family enzyme